MSVKKRMDEASKELDDHGYGDLIGGAVENLNELSKKLSVLEHFTAIHIDMADILLQKVRNEALLCRDALADTEDITCTTNDRRAFETQLDAVYRNNWQRPRAWIQTELTAIMSKSVSCGVWRGALSTFETVWDLSVPFQKNSRKDAGRGG
jgi:hypothetical protein